jgi:hypothetical protein
MQEYRDRTEPSHPPDGEPMSGVASWYETHRRILLFAADLPAKRYLRVRSEDALNDTQSQFRAIADWLGIRADEQAIEAMQHPEASPFARPGPAGSGVIGGNDPGFLRDPIPRKVEMPGNLDLPSGWIADRLVWRMVADMANRLGYG